jgi:hypothetical protein
LAFGRTPPGVATRIVKRPETGIARALPACTVSEAPAGTVADPSMVEAPSAGITSSSTYAASVPSSDALISNPRAFETNERIVPLDEIRAVAFPRIARAPLLNVTFARDSGASCVKVNRS